MAAEKKQEVRGIIVDIKPDQVLVLADDGGIHSFPAQNSPLSLTERVVTDPVEEGKLVSLGRQVWSQDEISQKLYRYDRIAADRIPSANDVLPEHVKRFWDQGYLVIDQLLNPDEVDAARAAIMDIIYGRIEGPRVFSKGGIHTKLPPEQREFFVRKLHKYIDYSEALHHVGYHPDILNILGRLFGKKAKLLEDQAILKPPSADAGGEKPWHQDMAYGNLSQIKMVCGVWIALDEAGLDNGCMHVIPSSHKDGPVPHYAIRDWQLCDARVDIERDVAVTLQPGGALFFAGMLHHGTPPNLSGKRRRALQLHYCPESSRKMTPEEFKMMFTNEITNAEC